VVGRIRSIEKSNDLIGKRTCDLPPCSIVLNQLRAAAHVMVGNKEGWAAGLNETISTRSYTATLYDTL
jgi:hypothetical protein